VTGFAPLPDAFTTSTQGVAAIRSAVAVLIELEEALWPTDDP